MDVFSVIGDLCRCSLLLRLAQDVSPISLPVLSLGDVMLLLLSFALSGRLLAVLYATIELVVAPTAICLTLAIRHLDHPLLDYVAILHRGLVAIPRTSRTPPCQLHLMVNHQFGVPSCYTTKARSKALSTSCVHDLGATPTNYLVNMDIRLP